MQPRLADRFREIGLTADAFRQIPPRHAALRDDAAALALRLFRDRGETRADEARSIFGGVNPPECLLRVGATVRAAFRLDIIEGVYLFSDWPSNDHDAVLPPGETTAILYRFAMRVADRDVLDLGCGSGTLSLLLARASARTVGTDVNPRAVKLANLNAEVNGIADVDFREGDLYAPLSGDRFDLIVSQPPFVPEPPGTPHQVFLHGGKRGDEVARRIVAEAVSHLTKDGLAVVFSDWPLAAGESIADRIPSGSGAISLYASPPIDPVSYAAGYGDELSAHFSEQGIVCVRQALLMLRAGTGYRERLVLPHEWNLLNPPSVRLRF